MLKKTLQNWNSPILNWRYIQVTSCVYRAMYMSVSFHAPGNNFIDTEIDFQSIINLIVAFGHG